MSRIDEIAVEAAVKLLRNVPWGPGRDALLAKAALLDREASLERGWDNYSTAAALNWNADLHRFAAEARFPREGDRMVANMRMQVLYRLSEIVRSVPFDSDAGELSVRIDQAIHAAIPKLSDAELCVVADELAAEGMLDDPGYWKADIMGSPAPAFA